ncbi:protein lethal(2)essential for life isoform X1 [Dendroctonus ponderosae]|uniref:SHSP domain-containing protein n=1 Tax=Dendroctonus ponderosae TaxID=77166 RepID=J3JZ07_DENPD|nr:protein lethal(2)essential for life isoform X1 [Dendroctonus ponderosae]XP_019771216.1 protein lethal(2)essential for life isoform X1 [Dendroctonus ponderosae]XP_019771217.1 protein lethal(2)essential for life isoform X1 [Dendroctonus ponderosae]AEE63445.1 unknown [Dendroctonus ponderosae]
MSVIPMLYRDWWDEEDWFNRPSRLLDQQFGLGLKRDDLLNSFRTFPRSALTRNYVRPWSTSSVLQRQESGSTIQQDKDKFQKAEITEVQTNQGPRANTSIRRSKGCFEVILDVQQFAPNEITVKTTGNSIIVEGKHEEKQDEHGFISRHFVRRYVLPSDNDIEEVVSSLSSDGILTVTAPKKSDKPKNTDRVVPIQQTGPAKSTVTSSTPEPKVEHPTN